MVLYLRASSDGNGGGVYTNIYQVLPDTGVIIDEWIK